MAACVAGVTLCDVRTILAMAEVTGWNSCLFYLEIETAWRLFVFFEVTRLSAGLFSCAHCFFLSPLVVLILVRWGLPIIGTSDGLVRRCWILSRWPCCE